MRKEAEDFAGAERHYLRAKTLLPEDPDLAIQLGHFYNRSERLLEALASYQLAAELDPGNEAIARELADMEVRVLAQLGAPQIRKTFDRSPLEAAIAALTIDDIEASGLFDANWYLKTYSDIAQLGLEPLRHFFEHGREEGRRPGPGFESDWYLQTYPEVATSGIEPFAHYLVYGRAQGMRPAGPPMYQRWVETFDTLGAQDFDAISADIRRRKVASPDVILFVDAAGVVSFSRTVQSLNAQCLPARRIWVCLAASLSPQAREVIDAAIGANRAYRLVSDGDIRLLAAGEDDNSFTRPAIVVVRSGAALREHALYLLALARADGAVFAYGDEDRLNDEGVRAQPFFKPDASPLLLRQLDYIGGCFLLPASTATEELFWNLSQDGTFAAEARAAFQRCDRTEIAHVTHVLFHDLRGGAEIEDVPVDLPAPLADANLPSVTIIIPTRDRVDLLQVCVESLLDHTDYPHDLLDIVIVDNGSADAATLDYLAGGAGRFRVLRDPQPFNYARLNNLAARESSGEVIVLLNNDTQIEQAGWLRGLLRYAILPDVAAVGAKLLYEDGTIQHAGVVLGIGVAAAHAHVGIGHDALGTYGFAQYSREVTAVTGACLAIRRSVFDELGGLDEKLAVAFNDAELCLSAIQHGYRNIYVHDVWVRHFESKSRGVDDTSAKVDMFIREADYARRKYPSLFASDPFYNPNLSLRLEKLYEPAFPPRRVNPWYGKDNAPFVERILILAPLRKPGTALSEIVVIQAAYLVERGYEVLIGSPIAQSALSTGSSVRLAVLPDDDAAATYAVVHRVDCILAHGATYADVSRLLGGAIPVVVQHHGRRIEEEAAGSFGRAAKVALRLAAPVAALMLASSSSAAAEIGSDVAIHPPGNDRGGLWSAASIARHDQVRKRFGWSSKIVLLVERPVEEDAALYLRVVERLEPSRVVLIAAAKQRLPGLHPGAYDFEQQMDEFLAADLFWPAADGSALLEAEAAGFGLPIIPRTKNEDARTLATIVSTTAMGVGIHSPHSRRVSGASWAEVLPRLESLILAAAAAPYDRNVPPRALLLKASTLIEDSGLFDKETYLHFNPDVAASGVDPWHHFVHHGAREGRRCSYMFDEQWYFAEYPKIRSANLPPLVHYLSDLAGECDPNPYFSNDFYLESYPNVSQTGLSPLVHYLRIGASEGYAVGDNFDAKFYSAAYPDVAPSGMLPFEHFMRIGEAEGRLPVQPILSPIDLFDDAALERYCDRPIDEIVPPAKAVVDRSSAACFCIALLRMRPDLRHRFPKALSEGAEGAFARWIVQAGKAEFGLSDRAARFILTLLEADFAARVRQLYLTDTALRQRLPFALLAQGRGSLLDWAVETGIPKERFEPEEIWWLLLTSAEDPVSSLWTTYSFTPAWQCVFPDAQTVFGFEHFAAFLRETFGLSQEHGAWGIDPMIAPPVAIRLAYNARLSWQDAHPDPFATAAAAQALLEWLLTPAAACDNKALAWLKAQNWKDLIAGLITPGVNMMGHFCYPSGLRTATEALVRGCDEVGLNTSLRDIWVQRSGDEDRHSDFRGPELYDCSIILCQPEPLFDSAFTRAGLGPRSRPPYRIGYWYWELDEIPDSWIKTSEQLDEVWTATHFVGDALKKKIPVPVRVIPHGVESPVFKRRPRSHFGLPDNEFLFLFTFHMMSVMERKNPLGLIKAFRDEFAPDEKVGLVLKTSFGSYHPEQMAEMRLAAAGANITIIDSVYTKDEVLALMECCDSYISLHRSEGFGLTMAEAMLIGKPTIATGYSANLDFMSADNSLLVNYDLVKLDQDYPPYKAGSHWAHASLRHAGECMRRVQSDPAWASALGAKGKSDLEIKLSFAASGRLIAARLEEISDMRRNEALHPAA